MAVIEWDGIGDKLYETGVQKGVLYLIDSSGEYSNGYAWNGLRAVEESPSGADTTDLWADNSKYLSLQSAEKFDCTISAYTYPEQFEECDGSKEIVSGKGVYAGQQDRRPFGLCYRTTLGNDSDGNNHGYKLHLVYGCKASPSAKSYSTINDSPEAIEFSWSVSTTPVPCSGLKDTATIVIDSTVIPSAKLTVIEDLLYGTSTTEPSLPTPNDIITILNQQ